MPCEPMTAKQLPVEQKVFTECWQLLRLLAHKDADRDEAECRKSHILQYGTGSPVYSISSTLCDAIFSWAEKSDGAVIADGGSADTSKETDVLLRCWELIKTYAGISVSDDEAWDDLLRDSEVLYYLYAGTRTNILASAACFSVVNYCEARSLLSAGADPGEIDERNDADE